MLSSWIWILLGGLIAGRLAQRLGAPPLLGMVLAGAALGPQLGNMLSVEVLQSADALRSIAVMVVLMKAGLGLDPEKLAQQGTVALRLGFLPAAFEAIAVAFCAMWLFQFDFFTGLLLGCLVGAESPAVIVPGMLRLKRLGYGVKKGIPDAILMGSALSDVLLLLVFSLLLAFLSQTAATEVVLPGGFVLSPLQVLPFQVVMQVSLGVVVGWLSAKLLIVMIVRQQWVQPGIQSTLIVASSALLLVVTAQQTLLFSGYLAVMATGFFLIQSDPPFARQLRQGFGGLWTIAEIVLFVLLGASIQIGILEEIFWLGLLLLVIGTLIGRSLGWYLSTLGSNWTFKERLFLLPGNSAKATVQAAIGAIPLAMGIEGGEVILAIAALSILITAPAGAWAIPTFAPKLLQRDRVDPTKTTVDQTSVLLAAVDSSPTAKQVLLKAAEMARHSEASVVVIHIYQQLDSLELDCLEIQSHKLLADIRHQFVTVSGSIEREILQAAITYHATDIVVGKNSFSFINAQTTAKRSVGSVAHHLLEMSELPITIVEAS
ncbi:transporter, CPA2 family [Synechococcus sp. PCC 7335]|uniref:cation:proton antiporter domain-containing protein n=1 Tax=Synechococcus sp. (strain ATCC 29403 / PCC 7335) TaxID=91464 RepID=UPI00017EB48B|nr:cation:proton antiporter [Synechococcus sp. PCC 7335]EDX87493.1 transporter, CPA2 family [Synechococcus sp. PCC 7335]